MAWLILLVAAPFGCADPCEQLQRVCDRCVDPNQKASCEAVVDLGTGDGCTEGIDAFKNVCE